MTYDWGRIEHEYVTGSMTLAELAEKYKIKLNTMYRKAEVRKFREQREEYTNSVREKALTRARARDARTLANLSTALDKAGKILKKYMDDEDMLFGRVVEGGEDGVREYRVRKLDTKAVRDMTAAIREATAAMQLMTGRTEQAEEEQAGVIVIPQREMTPIE